MQASLHLPASSKTSSSGTLGLHARSDDFFAAGTICLSLISALTITSDLFARDGWHLIPEGAALKRSVSSSDYNLLEQLDYLTTNHFVSATSLLVDDGQLLLLRIYLLPYDLSNVQGALRRRSINIVATAQKHLRALIQRLDVDSARWEGSLESTSNSSFLDHCIDNRTMAEIYGELPSPAPSSTNDVEHIHGLRSRLYPYQKETVAEMLDRELRPHLRQDPTYLPTLDIIGKTFYVQPATLEILRERPQVESARGGILCEELGTGKTVMTLALILATRDQLPQPQDVFHEARPVLTPLSLRHFPYQVASDERKRIRESARKLEQPARIPALVDILTDFCSRRREDTYLREGQAELEARNLWVPVWHNTPFYHETSTPPDELSKTRRKTAMQRARRMYLSSATLVVVPITLLGQWENEIMKHCEDVLSVLVLRAGDVIPPAAVLASQYDVILVTQPRFTDEAKKNDLSKLRAPDLCRCTEYPGSRVPQCRCNSQEGVSPVFQIRWKRLVVDEGHVTASMATTLTSFVKELSVERKWIVTGTPTTHLLGLDFGQGSNLQYPEDGTEVPDIESGSESNDIARRWTLRDREDIRKLSIMMGHFLGIPMFARPNGMDIFTALVTEPLMDASGPLLGAIRVLEQAMNMVMVRHRIDDVEKDILLPFLDHETILLDLDYYAAKSYNAMQGGIAINAVDSERKDQDYLFHPRNKRSLALTIENISQVLFWHVDSEKLFNVDETAARSGAYMNTMRERDTAAADVDLMSHALKHIRSAAGDPIWRALQAHPDIFHRTSGIPQLVCEQCKLLDQGPPSRHTFVSSDRLADLRDVIHQQPLARVKRIADWAAQAREAYNIRLLWAQAELKLKKGGSRDKTSDSAAQLQLVNGKDPKEQREELRHEWQEAVKRLRALATQDEGSEYPAASSGTSFNSRKISKERARLLSMSPLAGARVLNSTSSKLDYILNEVRSHCEHEKFLIFSKSPATLALVREGLELLGIKYLVYTSLTTVEKVGPREREQRVTTFETSEVYRIFLMELKYGARGLNLVAASRVIFCEPVWQPDVETQAIKRVHRIGQTQPVTVKTLAIRNTFEEFMTQRRDALKGRQPDLLEDRRMRDFIENPTFLDVAETSSSSRLDIPLINIPQIDDLDDVPGSSTIAHEVSTPPLSGVGHLTLSSSSSTSVRSSRAVTPARRRKRPAAHFDDEAVSIGHPLEQGAHHQSGSSESPNPKKHRSVCFLEDPSLSTPERSPPPTESCIPRLAPHEPEEMEFVQEPPSPTVQRIESALRTTLLIRFRKGL